VLLLLGTHATVEEIKPLAKKTVTKETRVRSPNYPAISLPGAVELVRPLVEKDGKAGAPLEIAVSHMGFSSLHGQARAVISALRKFRLVDDQGGRIVPTATAIDIVRFPATHQRNIEAKRAAALSPAIYKAIIDRYGQNGELPSDESLKPELETDFEFNRKATEAFLTGFRESLLYAGLVDGNRLLFPGEVAAAQPKEEVQQEGNDPMELQRQAPPVIKQEQPIQKASAPQVATDAVGPSIKFDLPRGNVIEIRMRSKVTKEEFDKVKRIFELAEVAFLEDRAEPAEPDADKVRREVYMKNMGGVGEQSS
jgi:hypothetical protein